MVALVVAAVAVGLDNFGATIGIGAMHGASAHRWRVAAVFGLFEALMPLLGLAVGRSSAHSLAGAAPIVGGTLVGLLGGYAIVDGLRDRPRRSSGPSVPLPRLVAMGVVLSLDNLVVGFALGTFGVNLVVAVVVIGLVSVALSLAGLELGGRIGARIGERSEVFGGVALVVVGVLIGLGVR